MMRADEVTIDDYRGLGEFRYQIRRFLRFSEQVAREAGIEPQQHQLLLAIKGLPEGMTASISILAERLQIQHHSAVELVDRLVERGLVERRRDEDDLRRVLVKLTLEGEDVLRNLSRHTLIELRSIGPALVGSLSGLIDGTNEVVQDEQVSADGFEEEGE
ncbi:MAG TPA: MarR family transcriptional regulator [Ktedonobacter sp.]|jgi:DNA-binding MarR family transcriptional regulator|nr:MarR family transcriptional regulator [Ktedonobacter sp.]